MKKISRKLVALLSLLLICVVGGGYLTSCSSDDDDNKDESPSLTISADSAVSVKAGDKIDVTVTASLKNDSFAGNIPADTNLAEYVTVTPSSTSSFSDDLSVTAAEAIAAGSSSAKVKISVTTTATAVSGTISVTIKASALKSGKNLISNAMAYTIESSNPDDEKVVVATAASWDFTTYADADWTGDGTADGHAGSKIKKDDAAKNSTTQYLYDGQYYLTEDIPLVSSDVTLTLSKTGTGFGTTKLSSGKEQPYSYKYGTNAGLRIKNDAIKIAGVKGNVVLKIEWSSMQNKDAGNRKLEVTVGDSGTPVETATTATGAAAEGWESVPMADFTKEISAGEGTNIYIGCSNNIFIKTVVISAQSGTFSASVNSNTSNDEATLGLVGTIVESSDSTVATAEIKDGKIAITSAKAGVATITVKDADAHEATIAVTVSASGNIELGTITKYVVPSETSTGKWNFKSKTEAPTSANSWDGSTALEADVVISADSGTGSITVLKGQKAKYNNGLQFSNGSVQKRFSITGTGSVTIKGNLPSDPTADKPAKIYADGDEANAVSGSSKDAEVTYTVTLTAETTAFFCNDIRILSVEFN